MKKERFEDIKLVLEACGFEVMIRLLQCLSGLRLHIPAKPRVNKDMLLVISICGEDVAMKLMEQMPGMKIYIPVLRRK
jgi:hypothetical protein